MNKEQLNSDKKVLASLEAEYKRAQHVIYSIRELVTDLNFEELIPDSQERCLMVDELQAYDYIRTNLMNRIRFYRNRVKRDENIKDWSQYKKTNSTYIGVDVHNEGDHEACCHVGEGPADVNETPDGIKALEGMQVVHAFNPGHRCDGCSNYTECNRNWKKLELVGGYYLCLAPLPNSIVTE